MTNRNDNEINEDELRQLYIDHHAEQAGPSDDELVELLLGELHGAQEQAVIDRLLQSPAASERYRLLKDLHREATHRSRRPRRFVQYAVAATVMLGIGIALLRPIDDMHAPERGEINAASPSGYLELDGPPATLDWQSSTLRQPYKVSMFDESGTVLWQVDNLQSQWLTLSEENKARNAVPGAYFWIVEDAAGVEAGPYWFRVGAD